jgi:hypothetical protein
MVVVCFLCTYCIVAVFHALLEVSLPLPPIPIEPISVTIRSKDSLSVVHTVWLSRNSCALVGDKRRVNDREGIELSGS